MISLEIIKQNLSKISISGGTARLVRGLTKTVFLKKHLKQHKENQYFGIRYNIYLIYILYFILKYVTCYMLYHYNIISEAILRPTWNQDAAQEQKWWFSLIKTNGHFGKYSKRAKMRSKSKNADFPKCLYDFFKNH